MAKAQVVKYKCCGKVFAACREPHCYSDVDWMKDLRKYAKDGFPIETLDVTEFKLEMCSCKAAEKKLEN